MVGLALCCDAILYADADAGHSLGLHEVLLSRREDHLLGNVAGTALGAGRGLPVTFRHGLDGSHEVGSGIVPEPDLLDQHTPAGWTGRS